MNVSGRSFGTRARSWHALLVVSVIAAGFVALAPTAAAAAPSATALISANLSGLGGNANSGNGVRGLDVSADGRIVVFDSYATDLVPSDTNGTADVFVRDTLTGTTELADVDSSGVQGTSSSNDPAVSADGRYVVFTSLSALDPSDTNGLADTYVRDLVAHTTTRASVTSAGDQLTGDGSSDPDISGDGRFVSFSSGAAELVSPIGGTHGYHGVFVRDMVNHTTTRLDVSPSGAENDQGSQQYRSTINGGMSPNGRFVAFVSTGSNLVPGGTTERCDLGNGTQACLSTYVRDRDPDQNGVYDEANASTTLASVDDQGTQANNDVAGVSVSDQGDTVMWSNASNLGAAADVIVHDHSGVNTIVGHGNSNNPVISGDGRYVAFDSYASNLVAGDSNSTTDTFVFDRITNSTVRVSVDASGGEVSYGGVNPAISDDGRYAAFTSYEPSLLPAGSPTLVSNVFLRDTQFVPPPPNTFPGSSVVVTPTDAGSGTSPAALTFDTVTDGGTTSISATANGPTPPGGFQLGTPATYYDISTTATFNGNVTVCITYDPTAYSDPNSVSLWHFENPAGAWVNITTSLDTATHVVCGVTTSFSPFTILEPAVGGGGPSDTTISGTVTDSSGQVLGGIQVSASGNTSSGTATTAADGSYTISGLTTDTYRVYFYDLSNTYSPEWYDDQTGAGSAVQLAVTTGTATTNIDAALSITTISGTVTNSSGHPLGGIHVSASGAFSSGLATTGADGTYTISGLTTDNYRVYFYDLSTGYSPEWYDDQSDVSTAVPLDVVRGTATTNIDAAVSITTISGTVTNSSGHPQGGIDVSASGAFSSAQAVTGVDGTYTISGLTTDTYRIAFYDPSSATLTWWNNKTDYATADAIPMVRGTSVTGIDSGPTDNDGVPSTVEDGAPNGGDGNGDGVPDSQQSNVTSLPNAIDGLYVSVASPSGTDLVNVAASPVPTSPPPPPHSQVPVGMLSFEVHGVPTGGSVAVQLFLPAGVTPNVFLKLQNGAYIDATSIAQFSGNVVTLTLSDGGPFDADGVANGIIADPIVPTVSTNRAPVANNNVATAAEDTPRSIAAPGVLGNDTDADHDALHATIVTNAAHGTVVLAANGSYVYTPESNYNGTDSFTYRADDGFATSNVATVTITVTPVNDAPTAAATSVSTNEDAAAPITLTGTDVDGDATTFTVVNGPSHGSLGSLGTRVCSGTAPRVCTRPVTYTPSANFNGSDSFTYRVNDGTVNSPTATVTIMVIAVNDAPTASSVSTSTNEDTAKPITLTGVDVDGDSTTVAIVGGPAHGSLALGSRSCSGTAPRTCTRPATYTPAADYNGSDSFTYKENDGQADSNVATVTITVHAVNDAPTASTVSATTAEDTAVLITATGTDVDGDATTFTVVGGPAHGSLGSIGARVCSGIAPRVCTRSATYTPSVNYHGPDSITYRVNDGTVNSPIATVNITVTAVDDAPTISAVSSKATSRNTPITVPFTVGDVDNSANSLTPSATSLNTTVVPNANFTFGGSGTSRTVKITPALGKAGTTTITLKVSDGTLTTTTTFTLVVT